MPKTSRAEFELRSGVEDVVKPPSKRARKSVRFSFPEGVKFNPAGLVPVSLDKVPEEVKRNFEALKQQVLTKVSIPTDVMSFAGFTVATGPEEKKVVDADEPRKRRTVPGPGRGNKGKRSKKTLVSETSYSYTGAAVDTPLETFLCDTDESEEESVSEVSIFTFETPLDPAELLLPDIGPSEEDYARDLENLLPPDEPSEEEFDESILERYYVYRPELPEYITEVSLAKIIEHGY